MKKLMRKMWLRLLCFVPFTKRRREYKLMKQVKAAKRAMVGLEKSMIRSGYSRQYRRQFWRKFISEDIEGRLRTMGF